MALIKCPECGNKISSFAEICLQCGFPLARCLEMQAEADKTESSLMEKIHQCEFTIPEPRTKVCIKCTKPFLEVPGEGYREPTCRCGMPGVEVDYHELFGGTHSVLVEAYILENCVVPRNIGDQESDEYREYVSSVYDGLKEMGRESERTPPSPEYFGVEPTSYYHDSPLPHCPICGSTELKRVSATKSFIKIQTFGLAGAGDVGKAWKCRNCGTRF